MSRLSYTPYEQMSEEQKQLIERIGRTKHMQEQGRMGGPHDVWILNPELARRAMGMGDMFRFRTGIDRRYIELAILITGAFWKAKYEWYAHEPMAREAGVPDTVIDAVRHGREPAFEDDGDAAAWMLCSELHSTHRVSDETFERAVAVFGQRGVAELVTVSGYYTLVSMTLNAFEVPMPAGVDDPWDG